MPLMVLLEIVQDADTPTHTWTAGTRPKVEASLAADLVKRGLAKYVDAPAVEDAEEPDEPLRAIDSAAERKKRKLAASKAK